MQKRSVAVVVLLVAVFVVFAPLASGWWFQKKYQELISYYNSQGDIQAKLVQYQRGWMSSNAKLVIEIKNPIWLGMLPSITHMTVDQHVQHGPIFFHRPSGITSFFGLAAINNDIHFLPEVKNPWIKTSTMMMSFGGNCFQHFQLNHWKVTDPESSTEVKLGDIEGSLWISPDSVHVSGDLNLTHFLAATPDGVLEMKDVSVRLDQQKESHGLWIGNHTVTLSKMTYHDDEDNLAISDLDLNGSIDEASGWLSGDKQLSIGKLQLDDETIGPVQLQISAHKLSAQVFADMLNAYQDIMQNGELYQSELRKKMLQMLPNVISPGADIQLTTLSANSPSGKMQMSGDLSWPAANFAKPSDVGDLLDLASKNFSLRISKEFTNKIIKFAAALPYFVRHAAVKERPLLLDARDQMELAIRENASFLATLVEAGALAKQDKDRLLDMQKALQPIDQYSAEVKNLLLTRQITLSMSYLLYWQYATVSQPYLFLENKMNEFQKTAEKTLRAQLNNFIKQGYVTESHGDYIVALTWPDGKLTANGREVK